MQARAWAGTIGLLLFLSPRIDPRRLGQQKTPNDDAAKRSSSKRGQFIFTHEIIVLSPLDAQSENRYDSSNQSY